MKFHRMTSIQGRHFAGMRVACLVAFVLFGSMASAHGAGVFRVDAASAASTPDGQSWETAYPTLQAAVDAAVTAGGGDLWVRAGTYTGAGEQVVLLSGGVNLYGGFAGDETDRSQRDWKANPTIIDGEGARRCVMGAANATVDGFTLTAGKSFSGGGMLSGTAVNCIFSGNTATAVEGAAHGGGMQSGTATNCIFTGNTAVAWAEPFYGESQAYGGGTYDSTATNCVFTGNAALASGGVCYAYGGGMCHGTATNCTVEGNRATALGINIETHGGGMYGGTAVNCIFWLNSAVSGSELGGTASVIYSCVRGGYPGEGNIDAFPKFANAPYDLRLLSGSPCVDTGTVDIAPADDIVGIARPQGAGVDMGAYESAALGVPHAPVVGADASGANPPTWTWTPGGGGIGQYRFGFAEGMWEAVDLAATAYTPPIPLPAGNHTLYVQERDALGNWSASGTHTLTVADTAAPAGTIVINGNAATTASSTVALALTWDDGLNGSGVSRMRFSNNGTTWSPWERAASLKPWALPAGTGYKTVRAQFLDRSGNRSAVCSDYIKVVAP